MHITLADLKNGQEGTILSIKGHGGFRKRIMEMGFIKGQLVKVIKNAPFQDPIEYQLMHYHVSLRRNESRLIEVACHTPAYESLQTPFHGTRQSPQRRHRHGNRDHAAESTISVALVGNPNSGKTTLFNRVTGSRERVGNYAGVTVAAKKAHIRHRGYRIELVDLPGTYSLTEYTPEELFVREHLLSGIPDVIVNIVDASNLERNLYLTTQLIDMDLKVVTALNMYDEMTATGDSFAHDTLGAMVGIPFVPTVASRGTGIDELLDRVVEVYEDRDPVIRHVHINYGTDIELAIAAIEGSLEQTMPLALAGTAAPRYIAIKLLEDDKPMTLALAEQGVIGDTVIREVHRESDRLRSTMGTEPASLITDARYGFIAGALRETYHPAERPTVTRSDSIDRYLTDKIMGIPIFLLFLWLTFTATFTLGQYPKNLIEGFFGAFGSLLSARMAEGLLKDLLINGIITGAGGVLVFLPNIIILFLMISIMEDSGYMARAVFIMDRVMHRIGLHGKSFIPLIMGFGCNVPAIMATRTIESRSDRMLTLLIVPFMSCSARLPVYIIFISAFFPASPGTMLFFLYLLGIAVGVLSALLLKRMVFKHSDTPFVMELPPYRIPHVRSILRHMWDKSAEYLKKIGSVILIASILIWAVGAFPRDTAARQRFETGRSRVIDEYALALTGAVRGSGAARALEESRDGRIASLERTLSVEQLDQSIIGRAGKFVQPVMAPLGFDWKMTASAICGLAAKEIVVSTMGILYNTNTSSDTVHASLVQVLRGLSGNGTASGGNAPIGPRHALAFMVFVLLYLPCVGTLITIRRESGTWRWAVFSAILTTTVAWIAAFIAYQAGGVIWG